MRALVKQREAAEPLLQPESHGVEHEHGGRHERAGRVRGLRRGTCCGRRLSGLNDDDRREKRGAGESRVPHVATLLVFSACACP